MKSLGVHPFLYPMPTYMINTYNEDGSVDSMMMAWGGICGHEHVILNLEEDHKTVANLKRTKAFTLAVPGTETLEESDYLGMVSCNKVPDKFEKTGLTAEKSSKVNAPIVKEWLVCLECEVVDFQEQVFGLVVIGKIVDVLADEKVLVDGKIDPEKLNAFAFCQMNYGYYAVKGKVGQAWESGKKFV